MESAIAGGRARPRCLLCLVTPGRSPAFAAVPSVRAGRVTALVKAAIRAGLDLVQVREADLPVRLLLDIVRDAVRASRETGTRIIVNDRLDVALAGAADGVHLGSASISPARVRDIAPPGFMVGCSVHSTEDAVAASDAPVDYLIAGTVFRSPSKPPETPLLGTAGLAAIVSASRVPVLAIGGIDLRSAAMIAATGASGVAAISLFREAGPGLPAIVHELRQVFDRVGVIP